MRIDSIIITATAIMGISAVNKIFGSISISSSNFRSINSQHQLHNSLAIINVTGFYEPCLMIDVHAAFVLGLSAEENSICSIILKISYTPCELHLLRGGATHSVLLNAKRSWPSLTHSLTSELADSLRFDYYIIKGAVCKYLFCVRTYNK